jgi:uncharacterized protein YxeA
MKKTLIVVAAVIVIGGLAGGGYYLGTKKNTSKNTPSTSSNTSSSQSTTTAQKQVDLSTVMASLKQKFPTITQTYIYSASQDPNNELGKPGGYYIAGAEFYDTKTNTPPDGSAFGADSGGAIEVYANTSDAAKRASYLEGFQSDPTLNPGAVKQDGVYVIRASQYYTAAQQNAVINYLVTQL